ncbi:MAG: peptidoglycan-binding domain-containing protein [Candidatus Limiplasma sp.]|nr:peptidoglycan-binding domain-containing protein [Candidatus Limiplasma sp.]
MKPMMKRILCAALMLLFLLPSASLAQPTEGVTVAEFESAYVDLLHSLFPSLPLANDPLSFTQSEQEDGSTRLFFSEDYFEILGYTFPHSDIIDSVSYLPQKPGETPDASKENFYILSFICGIMGEELSMPEVEAVTPLLDEARAEIEEGAPFGSYPSGAYTSYLWEGPEPDYVFYLHQHKDSGLLGDLFAQRFAMVHPMDLPATDTAADMPSDVEMVSSAPPPADTPPPDPEAPAFGEGAEIATQEPIAVEASYDFSALSNEELLHFWNQVGKALQDRGAYPYIQLAKGDQGIDVSRLQQRLADLYYFTGDLTGKYDDATVKAVKAFEKANGIKKGDGKMSIDEQDLLYSEAAAAKATPTPRPTPTPGPTPVPDEAAVQITSVKLAERYNTKTFSVNLKNLSTEYTVDAFTVVYRLYDTYGDLLSGSARTDGLESAEWWKDLKLKPNGKFSMGSYYWYLFADQTASRIEAAVSKYHTTDGKTVVVPPEQYIWVEGILK